MPSETSSQRRRPRWLGLLLRGAVVVVALLAVLAVWLFRDPTPRIVSRSGLATVTQRSVERSEGAVSELIQLTDSAGRSIPLLVRTPTDDLIQDPESGLAPDACGRRPVFLLLGGYRTGEDAAMLTEDLRGAVIASAGYPYDGPVALGPLDAVRYIWSIRRALLDTPGAVRLAVDHLLSLPEVDPERVELVGGSFGSFFVPAAAALDSRVTRVWLVHGSARPRLVLDRALERYISVGPLRALAAAIANVGLHGPWLAPERWVGRISPRPVVMINASDDETLPRAGVEALHESALEPKEQVWLAGPHVRPTRPDVVQELVDAVLSRAAEDPPPERGPGPTLECRS